MTTVYPLVFRIGTFEITGFGILMMLAFLVGGWLVSLELRRRGWNEEYGADIVVAAVIGGIVGAKLWYVALTGDPGALFSRGGLVWYGGFLGGVLAVILNGWRRQVPIRVTMNLVAPALAAAYAVGRVGCFVVGDDYGRPTDLPIGVKFPQGLPPSTAQNLSSMFGVQVPADVAPSTVLAVHPTQLYEVLAMLAVFMILWRWRLNHRPMGWLFGAYLAFAGVERFLVEILRAKDDRFLGVFTVAQLTSVVVAAVGVALLVRYANAPNPAPGAYLTARPR
ncbi:MAG: prolipoprotein diacylglyceryl transferase [Gemmatimonadales bacterium]|nr:prolipoprotein diacylglyceryl transferase [Gemmatimonadales bacterium]